MLSVGPEGAEPVHRLCEEFTWKVIPAHTGRGVQFRGGHPKTTLGFRNSLEGLRTQKSHYAMVFMVSYSERMQITILKGQR